MAEKMNSSVESKQMNRYETDPREWMSLEQQMQEQKGFVLKYIDSDVYRKNLMNEIQQSKKIADEEWVDDFLCSHTEEEIFDIIYRTRRDRVEKATHKIKRLWFTRTQWRARTWMSRDKNETIEPFVIPQDGNFFWILYECASMIHFPLQVEFNKNQHLRGSNAVWAHEYSHIATQWYFWMLPSTYISIDEGSQLEDTEYYWDPSEIYARMISLKYLLWKTDICDPFTEQITSNHLDQLLKYEFMYKRNLFEDKWNSALHDLFEKCKIAKPDLLELMNTIAQNESISNTDIATA